MEKKGSIGRVAEVSDNEKRQYCKTSNRLCLATRRESN